VDIIYTDFSKAFDKVPHKRLINQIKAHGIEGTVIRWIQNWLDGRRQRTVVNGHMSEWIYVTSSVIQGSVLGPTCFIMYINDLEENVDCSVSKFADDTKMYMDVSTKEGNRVLQRDIDKVVEWADKWQMEFNSEKCAVMHIGSNNRQEMYAMKEVTLKSTNSEKDLGVWIDNTLKPGFIVKKLQLKLTKSSD